MMNYNEPIKYFNNKIDSYLTISKNEIVGGRNQEWKQILENICKRYIKQKTTQNVVEEMGESKQNYRKLDVDKIKNPYIINPNNYQTQDIFPPV